MVSIHLVIKINTLNGLKKQKGVVLSLIHSLLESFELD